MKALLYTQYAEEAAILSLVLQQAGFTVRSIRDLERAVEDWPEYTLDFMLLTLSDEPQKFIRLVKQIRASTSVPIFVISENTGEESQINLLDAGVDLVILRPYSVRVLSAQVRSILRRSANIPTYSVPSLAQGGITLDPAKRNAQVDEQPPTHLTQLEFRLLYILMTHMGQIIPSENLVEQVWGYSGTGSRELVRGLVQRLRNKIEPDPRQPRYILTETGIGYYFNRSSEDRSND